MTVQETFDNFIMSRMLSDLSSKTITDYRMFIVPLVRFLGSGRLIESVSQYDIENYIYSLMQRPLARATRSTYIRHIKIYLKWCEERYEVQYKTKFIKVPKMPKKNVRIYSSDEIRLIFEKVENSVDWITSRNKSMIALMYDSGLRQAELCRLKRSWVDINQKRLKVHGKGDKERYVPLGSLAVQLLAEYLHKCPYDSVYVFVNRYGKPLTCNAVKLMISKLATQLDFELTSHKLRHNFATNYCINQYEKHGRVDIYSLMYILGHENIETTRRYLHLAMEIVASRESISHLDNLFLCSPCEAPILTASCGVPGTHGAVGHPHSVPLEYMITEQDITEHAR